MNQLRKFFILSLSYFVVDDKTFNKILFENFIRPYSELSATLTFDTVSNGNYYIQSIKCYCMFYIINTQKMRVVLFWQFAFKENVINMLSDFSFHDF